MPPTSPTPRKPPRVLRRLERTAVRALTGFVNGIEWWQRDPTDVVNQSRYDVVAQRGLSSVRRYRPQVHDDDLRIGTELVHYEAPRQALPVLLIPPLMVQPWIYDLAPRRSLVRTLLRAGFDVYLLDFGAPGKDDERLTLDDYVADWVPAAIDAVLRTSGAPALGLVGYCMGGLFALMHTAAAQDARVAALVTIGAPVDAHKMSLLQFFVRHGHKEIEAISKRLGNVPGAVSATAFRLTSPLKAVTRYSDLFVNLWNDDYVAGFDGVTAWTSQFVDYPGDAFRQLLAEFMKDNKLKQGTMTFGGHTADLGRIRCPVLAFAGRTDQIVPPDAARELLAVIGSEDKTFREVTGGHMGVMAGRDAPNHVWAVAAQWLGERVALAGGAG
ncbi:MAG: alpha/beta fold hydrolase [Deltaproteobacteria bacterium]|nr:alpha/beta fold hydrolase [Deltaproteobacteria bacterium]